MNKWENCTQVLIDLMAKEGYHVVSVFDGEETHTKDFIENATSTDEAYIIFGRFHNTGEKVKTIDHIGYYMIWGNCTYESINDYTCHDIADKVSDEFWNYFEEKANLYS
jgi:hypothetical protein